MTTRLSKLLSIQSKKDNFDEMHSYIIRTLKEIPGVDYHQDSLGNIYVVKGKDDKYPATVCHTDTNTEIYENFNVVRLKRNFWMAFVTKDDDELHHVPIGGAKAGIFVNLKLLEDLSNMKAAFFVNGEKEQLGAQNADIDFFKDCRWMLEFDRKNNTDIVTVGCGIPLCSTEFKRDLSEVGKKFGYANEAGGGDTDIVALKQFLRLPISSANLSSGVWSPRRETEHIVEGHLTYSIHFTKDIVKKLVAAYPHNHSATFLPKRCPNEGCMQWVRYSVDTICSECERTLRAQNLKCTACGNGNVYSNSCLFYKMCYTCCAKHHPREPMSRSSSCIL